MPDKLTDKEIVKALRSWLEEIRKARQEYLEKVNEEHYPSMRYEYLLSDTIHEINRLQARVELLNTELGIKELEYSMLERERAEDIGKFAEELKNLKAEAYKEFAEKANEIIDLLVNLMFDDNISKCQLPSCHKPSSIPCENEICIQENKEFWHGKLDNLLKELVSKNE